MCISYSRHSRNSQIKQDQALSSQWSQPHNHSTKADIAAYRHIAATTLDQVLFTATGSGIPKTVGEHAVEKSIQNCVDFADFTVKQSAKHPV